MKVHFGLICKFSDQIQNCPIKVVPKAKDWTFRFLKRYVCLITAENARLENIPPWLELVGISNHALKKIIDSNSWKNRSKLFQPSQINHVI